MHCTPPIANPTPNVTWIKNGVNLISSQSVIILEDNTLVFPHVSITDMANYSCTAENIAGRRISEPMTVHVYADGGWSQWGPWIECKCNGNKSSGRKRLRTCTNPTPLNGGSPCVGAAVHKTPDCITCQSIIKISKAYLYYSINKSLQIYFRWSLVELVRMVFV